MPGRGVVCVLVAHAAAVVLADACSTDLDCYLNGACVAGVCECDAGWRGADCGELDLVPPENLDGCYQHKVDLKDCDVSCGPSSWGGLPLKNETDGTYHLFASQFVNNCTLQGWNPGSTVIRAVADNPFGPFTYAETVMPTFHHNPTVRKLDGKQSGTGRDLYVMYMIGTDAPAPDGKGAACNYDGGKDPHHLEGYITMAWSESLLGPWTKSQHTILTSGLVGRWDAMVTNPGPLIAENGTAYLYYRGTNWPSDGLERIGVAAAASWRGPYGRLSDEPLWDFNDDKAFVEDPFVWRDARGVKMLSHGHWDENGYLAVAPTPEGPWTFRHAPTYTNVVAIADGTQQTFVQRERPQLWFDEATGAPSILFTGVAPPGAKFYGYTYTFAQRVGGSRE